MTRRILQSALLSLSVSLTGCAVYEVDHRGYSAPRYPSYGYQQPVYPRAYYPQYPRVQEYRYPRAPVVQVYRQPPPRYHAAPLWPLDAPRYQVERSRQRQHEYREERHGRYERDERRDQRYREQGHGWEIRRY